MEINRIQEYVAKPCNFHKSVIKYSDICQFLPYEVVPLDSLFLKDLGKY